MNLKRTIACGACSALLMSLAACGQQQQTAPPISSVSTPAISSQGPVATGNKAPDGSAIPGDVQWLSDLPDPRTIDRTQASAVARAYEITLHSWDTATDRDSNAGYMRSSIYGDATYQNAIASQAHRPATGDAIFVNARPHRSYATAAIRHAGSDGVSADANSSSITVAWRQTIIPRDKSGNDTRDGVDYVQLKLTDGKWAVTSMVLSTKGTAQ